MAGCAPRSSYRYRLTVEIDTPEGLRSGSSVISVRTYGGSNPFGLLPYAEISVDVRGEAVAVDLPDAKTLFALLIGEDGTGWAGSALMWTKPPPTPADAANPPHVTRKQLDGEANRITNLRGVHALPRYVPDHLKTYPAPPISTFPLLVTFADIRDPRTVIRVDPDDLAASFGPGISLRRIAVQITDDPVTTGIARRFAWWSQYKLRHFDGSSTASQDLTTSALSAALSSGSFSTEFGK